MNRLIEYVSAFVAACTVFAGLGLIVGLVAAAAMWVVRWLT